ncbi:MAG: histidine kinase [Thiothrix sp.]
MKPALSLKTKILLLVILPLLFLSGFIAAVGAQVGRGLAAEQQRILTTVLNDPELHDVRADVGDSLRQAKHNVQRAFRYILILLALTILAIMLLVWWVNLHESRLADRHLRELVHNFIRLQVEERRRFAHALHDGINQLIGAAKFRVELASRQLAKGKGDYQDSLGKAQETLVECMGEVRRISHGLRPGLLDEMGLEAAIKRLLEAFVGRTGIQIGQHLQIDQATMPDDAAIMLYRVLQEALTNIERHANACHVEVQLRQERHEAMLAISDDGQGFAPDHLPPGKGIGLQNMRERMELLDGSFQLESSTGHGTRIQAQLPL